MPNDDQLCRRQVTVAQQARASLASAKAARSHAATMSSRLSMLVGRRAVSVQENETAEASLRQAEAGLLEAQAAVERAELQLGYATGRAPIAGRAGRAQVSEGALVSAGAATLMTQVDQLDPVFATFNPSSSAMASLLERVSGKQRMTVALIMETASASRTKVSSISPRRRSIPSPAAARCVRGSTIPNASCCPDSSSAASSPLARFPTVSACPNARSRSAPMTQAS